MGDFDKMLTILTPNLGKIGCSAKGSRRPKSLLLSGTQFLCFGEYMVFKSGDNYSINSGLEYLTYKSSDIGCIQVDFKNAYFKTSRTVEANTLASNLTIFPSVPKVSTVSTTLNITVSHSLP